MWLYKFITVVPNLTSQGKTIAGAIGQMCSYFTITTNSMIAVTTLLALLFPRNSMGKRCAGASTITAITVYIIVVGLVYNIVLRATNHMTGLGRVGDELVHSAVPLLYIIYWLLFATKGSISWVSAYRWLLYPLLYLIYTFIRGLLTSWYPYPFMDVNKIGYTGFWLNSFYLMLLFVTLNLGLIGVDKSMAKRKK